MKMHVPIIPRDRAFKKRLREELMEIDYQARTIRITLKPGNT
jgi:hypothetical protein